MPSTPRTRATTAGAASVLALALAVGLTGCAPPSPKAVTDYSGEPKGVEAPASSAGGAPWAVWLNGGSQFAVTMYGSKKCPPTGTKVAVIGSQQVKITLAADPKGKTCTFGYSPHTTVFQTPSKIDHSYAVRITAQQVKFTLEGLKN
jgi:hypothetical protein